MIAIHHIINVKGYCLKQANKEILNDLYSPELTAASLAFKCKIHDFTSGVEHSPG